ncbi:MAG: hypothetical protein NC328_03520 [Muribaculum sp.]|nr:hypothetical protein [Muribaculum sp.]
MDKLFDKDGFLDIDEIIMSRPSYKKIFADGIVTDEELTEQGRLTLEALRKVESMCNQEQRAAVADAIAELCVLFASYQSNNLQNL